MVTGQEIKGYQDNLVDKVLQFLFLVMLFVVHTSLTHKVTGKFLREMVSFNVIFQEIVGC